MDNLLIIGASSGIGAAIAKLAQTQFQIYSLSRSAVVPTSSKHFVCDVTKDSLPAIDQPLAGLVYCPGSIQLKPFSSIKPNEFSQDYELNVLAAMRCLQHFQANLKAAKNPSVLLLSSVAVQTGFPYHALVSASKGAIEGLTRALAAEWSPHIRVNAIAPSITDTPLADKLLREETKKEAVASRHPLKRIGQPEDIAQMALFLLSDKSSWITGQILHVDGGVSALRL